MNICIRKLNSQNIEEIDIITNWFSSWYEWTKPYWTKTRIKKLLISEVNSNEFPAVFVACVNGQCIGTVSVTRFDSTRNEFKIHPWITDVFVDEKFRGGGVATQLIKHAEKYLVDLGYDRAYIRTDIEGIYEKFGYNYLNDIILDNGLKERLYVKELK